MSDESKTYPTHRVSFAAKRTGRDGKEELGRPVQIGAIWPRKEADKSGGILRLDIVPKDLQQGVIFVTENERQKAQTRSGEKEADRFDEVDRRAESRQDRGQGR